VSSTVESFIERAKTAATEAKADGHVSKEERAKIAKLASEFESTLVVQMLRDMRKSGSWDDADQSKEGLGAESMYDTLDVELANHLSKVQGFGLAKELTSALEKLQSSAGRNADSPSGLSMPAGPQMAAPQSAGPASLSVRPAAVIAVPRATGVVGTSAATSVGTTAATSAETGADNDAGGVAGDGDTALTMPTGKVTSEFGWRHDPFTGQAKFHRGVDLRAAYGQEVGAAGPGKVVFSGEQNGYGTTVVVEHANGTRSRYAHLSAALVSVGDHVDSSTPVGRAGHSGRATGTHLHFEITTADGRAVPPEQWTTRPALMASAMHQATGTAE
jgi:murein DD-endopeptidase MepM/ murein hydrolase activator NlpD